jgi:hypothetical protein
MSPRVVYPCICCNGEYGCPWNVKTMFFKGVVEKEIYVEKHGWFTQQQIEHLAHKKIMFLYGLKQFQMQGRKKFELFYKVIESTRNDTYCCELMCHKWEMWIYSSLFAHYANYLIFILMLNGQTNLCKSRERFVTTFEIKDLRY